MIGCKWKHREMWSEAILRVESFIMEVELYAVSEGGTSKIGKDLVRIGATPVTMSNTEVKTSTAEGTGLATTWKIRYLPVFPFIFNLAALVKWLTHWIVAPARVGSSPTSRPNRRGIAQLVEQRSPKP